jgi:exodeoxyribonuclease V alpha subunit
VATLLVNRRFTPESGIARLSRAVQAGDGPAALAVLQDPDVTDVELVPLDDDAVPGEAQLAAVRADVQARRPGDARGPAAAGDAKEALAAMDGHRLLCAHRRGLRGAAYWSTLVARWLAEVQPVVPREDGHHVGEPLMVTTNDPEVGLYNGDTGVVVDDPGRGLVAAFSRGGAPILVPLVRLGAVSRLHAMTVHRSQGSQFEVVTVVLPPAGSPLGTRETLYTAATRAMGQVRPRRCGGGGRRGVWKAGGASDGVGGAAAVSATPQVRPSPSVRTSMTSEPHGTGTRPRSRTGGSGS